MSNRDDLIVDAALALKKGSRMRTTSEVFNSL